MRESLAHRLIGPSRVYLGVHWASDVTAGYVIGLLLLSPAILVHRTLRARAATTTTT